MNWPVFGKAFLCETLYSIPFFILALFPFRNQLRFPLKNITFLIFSHPVTYIWLSTQNPPG